MPELTYRYELRFKTKGYPWRIFDTYKAINDPQMRVYFNQLSKGEFNESVQVIKFETKRTILDY